jgi:predicted nucleotidyltransferase component of viral defense system
MEKMNAMSLKAKIRNMAKEKRISAQVVLQHYFFEHFLERLSRSECHNKFILKGGFLIAFMAGLETRSTMDIDVTIRTLPLDEDHIKTAMNAICKISANDNIDFRLTRITPIRDDAEYGGFRISLEAVYENINSPLSIDITAGDIITPKPIRRVFKSLFDEASQFELLAYNYETILAEKVETILRRSVGNTRPRDFYDVFLITKTQSYDITVFNKALSATAAHRGTTEKIKNVPEILKAIKESPMLKTHWEKYQREYSYAKDISFDETVKALFEIMRVWVKKEQREK